MSLLISCDVGGDRVPAALIEATIASPVIAMPSRFPCDVSAAYAAKRLADGFESPLICNEYSSGLIDVGRSLHHRELFPNRTRGWSTDQKQFLIDQVYHPYRQRVRRAIVVALLRHSCVIHLSVRTFDSKCKGKLRRADVGLLYDPAYTDEVDVCLDWIDEMYDEAEMLKVRRNYPRRGTHDSITRAMRAEFVGMNYVGIEVMLNRAWAARPVRLRDEAIDGMVWSLRAIIDHIKREAA